MTYFEKKWDQIFYVSNPTKFTAAAHFWETNPANERAICQLMTNIAYIQ